MALVTLTQALPSFMGLVFVSYAFKFALLAQMNQGCIPSLFSVCSIYVGILFYFAFKESISCAKIIGIAMMVPCVILLSLDKKEESEDSDLSEQEMVTYGSLAILMGVLAPIFWTFKTYFARKVIDEKCYNIDDFAMD